MKIFKIWQEVNNDYDTYDSAVVIAVDENDARTIHPAEVGREIKKDYTWCELKDVQVEYIGEAKNGSERSIVCASFNAG